MNSDQEKAVAMVERVRAALQRAERGLAHLHVVLDEAGQLADNILGDPGGGVVIYSGGDGEKTPPPPP